MVIKKLILHRYTRLFLNNIEHLEYTPENNIQILLGRNGSGKSSVLAMLNPLPADIKRQFKEDGYKLIEIEHYGKQYILSSNFVSKNKHSFEVDGVELNPGGTRKVQLDLVYEHFRLTPNMNSVLIGLDNFTMMSSVDRKYWFTELSTVDYTFAITYYNKLKQRYRDIVGSSRLIQEEIIKAEVNINSDINLEKLIADKKHLEEMVEFLLSNYNHVTSTDTTEQILNDITQTSSVLKNLLNNLDGDVKADDIKSEMDKHQKQLAVFENQLQILNKEISILDKHIVDEPLEILEAKEKHLKSRIKHIQDTIDIPINLEMLEYIVSSYKDDYSDAIDRLNVLSEYTRVPFTNELFKTQAVTYEQHTIALRHNKHKLSLMELEDASYSSRLSEQNKISCDNCNHVFYYQYDKLKHDKLKKDIKLLTELITKQEKENEEHRLLLETLNSKKEAIQHMNSLMSSRSELKPIWEYMVKKHTPYHMNISAMVSEVDSMMYRLERWYGIVPLTKELNELLTKIVAAKEFKKHEITVSKERQVMLEDSLVKTTVERNKTKTQLERLDQQYKLCSKIHATYDNLKRLNRKYNTFLPIAITQERNKEITKLVNILKTYMVDIDQTVMLHKQQQSIVNENKLKLEHYLAKEKLLSLLLKELSPSEGIIAKSMNSFLNVFINEMNHIINTVWSYRIELLPCEISDDNDLDYKFKVLVDDNETIDDVCLLSSSMQEIVNLAYRIVFIKYLKVENMPLFLDEFGRTMDPAHQITAYNTVEQVMTENFLQIFIVSHFESMYGRFNNADISILDTNNINIDGFDVYNTVLKIG